MQSNTIQSNSIQSNPIQLNIVQFNPIRHNPIFSDPILSNLFKSHPIPSNPIWWNHHSSHCSTAEFRNAFLKTIRQIIRESVRNMSIPPAKPASTASTSSTPPTPKMDASQKNAAGNSANAGNAGSNGSGKSKRNMQRHSAGTIDYDNVETCSTPGGDVQDIDDDEPVIMFRGRSQTIGKSAINQSEFKMASIIISINYSIDALTLIDSSWCCDTCTDLNLCP